MPREFKEMNRYAAEVLCSNIAVCLVERDHPDQLTDDQPIFHTINCNEPLCKTCIDKRKGLNSVRLAASMADWFVDDSGENEDGALVFCTVHIGATADKVEAFVKQALRYSKDPRPKFLAFRSLTTLTMGAWVVEDIQGDVMVEKSELRILTWITRTFASTKERPTDYIEQVLLELLLNEFDVLEVEGAEVTFEVSGPIPAEILEATGDDKEIPFGTAVMHITKPFKAVEAWLNFEWDDDLELSYQIAIHDQLVQGIAKLRGKEIIHSFGLEFQETKPGNPILVIDELINIYDSDNLDEVIYHYSPGLGVNLEAARRPFNPRAFERYYVACERLNTMYQKQQALADYVGITLEDEDELDNLIQFATRAGAHKGKTQRIGGSFMPAGIGLLNSVQRMSKSGKESK